MGPVVGDLLPLALGIAISPMPVGAVIVMLLSARGAPTSVGFLIGWVAGVATITAAWTWLSGFIPRMSLGSAGPIVAALEIGIGAFLVVLGIRQWTTPPKSSSAMPRWMAAIDTMKPWEGLVLGVVYAALRPKNLALATAAGLVIGSGEISFAESVVAVTIFTVLASVTLALPIVAWFARAKGIRGLLSSLRERLFRSVRAITGTALLVLGVVVLGMGVSQV